MPKHLLYRPISHWRELFSTAPVAATNNLQIWLAVLSFSTAIVIFLLEFIARWWWYMWGIDIRGFPLLTITSPASSISIMDWFFGIVGSLFLLAVLIAIVAIIILGISSVFTKYSSGVEYDRNDVGGINKIIRHNLQRIRRKYDGKPE